jgi:hypothetical protein
MTDKTYYKDGRKYVVGTAQKKLKGVKSGVN